MPAEPIRPSERLDSLDLIRGVAIFGILMVNMAFFSMPFAHAIFPAGYESWPASDRWTYLLVKVFFEYKFVSTFSVLFGAGLIMQWMRAHNRGAAFGPLHVRRMAMLAVLGAMHGFLLWYGDILLIYACVGSVFFFFRTLTTRTLLIVAACLLAASLVLTTGLTAMQVLTESGAASATSSPIESGETAGLGDGADHVTGEAIAEAPADTPEPPRGFHAMIESGFDIKSQEWLDAEIAAYRDGPFSQAMVFRAVSFGFLLLMSLFGFGWHVLALFLIGAALMKSGFFAPQRRPLQGRLAVFGLIVGGALEAGYGLTILLWPAAMDWPDVAGTALHTLGAPVLCLGYVGALAWLASTGVGRVLLAPVRAVGRMALSAYLLSTISVTFIMYHWGLGWFGEVGRFDQAMIALGVYAGLVVLCACWMGVFRFGPFEWLWRTVTYGRAPVSC